MKQEFIQQQLLTYVIIMILPPPTPPVASEAQGIYDALMEQRGAIDEEVLLFVSGLRKGTVIVCNMLCCVAYRRYVC